jgi:hypothetical protein
MCYQALPRSAILTSNVFATADFGIFSVGSTRVSELALKEVSLMDSRACESLVVGLVPSSDIEISDKVRSISGVDVLWSEPVEALLDNEKRQYYYTRIT